MIGPAPHLGRPSRIDSNIHSLYTRFAQNDTTESLRDPYFMYDHATR